LKQSLLRRIIAGAINSEGRDHEFREDRRLAMIRVRRSNERGHFDHGWLDTYHTFSFGDYYDPRQMGFRSLRVLNEDVVAPGSGFPKHGHRDMEIITYVLSGTLTHADSLGNSGPIGAGEVQRMTAGTGVLHSEANESTTDSVHLLQIWIVPDRPGHAPGYEQQSVAAASEGWRLLAAPDGRDGAATLHQDVSLFLGRPAADSPLRHDLTRGRHAWVQVTRGRVSLNGQPLQAGDGAAVSDEPSLTIAALDDPAEVLLFDLA
jgi:quercetin 2,3-dioxygenase